MRRIGKLLFGMVMSVAFLASCSAPQGGSPIGSGQQTRAFVSENACAFEGSTQQAALAAAIAAPLVAATIKQAVTTIGTVLENAGKAGSDVETTSVNSRALQGELPRCILVVRANFEPRLDNQPAPMPAWFETMVNERNWQLIAGSYFRPDPSRVMSVEVARPAIWQALDRYLMRSGVQLQAASAPDFLFEAMIRSAPGGSMFSAVPVFAAYDAPMVHHFLRSSERRIQVSLALTKPGEADSAGIIELGAMRSGTSRFFNRTALLMARELPRLSLTPAELDRQFAALAFQGETRWQGSKIDVNGPLTVAVAITEHRDENQALTFLAGVFKEASPQITSALQAEAAARLFPRTPEQNAEREATRASAAAKVVSAASGAIEKLQACAALQTADASIPSDIESRLKIGLAVNAARAAQLDANAAALAAREPRLFPATLSPNAKPADCLAALQAVSGRIAPPPS